MTHYLYNDSIFACDKQISDSANTKKQSCIGKSDKLRTLFDTLLCTSTQTLCYTMCYSTIMSLHKAKDRGMHVFPHCHLIIIHDNVDPHICTGKSPRHCRQTPGYSVKDLAWNSFGMHGTAWSLFLFQQHA